jgi:hypothetical protein
MLSYLCTVHDHCIEYTRNDVSLTVWADSSWGKAPRPYGGFVIFYCGGPISWMSRIIKLIPLSSCEAELAIVSIACKDLRYILNLAEDCGQHFTTPVDVFTDNKGCYDLVVKLGVSARTRHYERWLYYVRELYWLGIIKINLVGTAAMIADIFTKALDKTTFLRLCGQLLKARA